MLPGLQTYLRWPSPFRRRVRRALAGMLTGHGPDLATWHPRERRAFRTWYRRHWLTARL